MPTLFALGLAKQFRRYGISAETVIFQHMSPRCDLDLEDSKPIFSRDTPADDDASLYHVWLQKIGGSENTAHSMTF